MSRNERWTFEARDLFYSELVSRFGPHAEWEGYMRPGRGLDEQFETFCRQFAELIGASSATAAKMQITFVVPSRRWEPNFAREVILNAAAAFRAGFVGPEIFATLAASDPAVDEAA